MINLNKLEVFAAVVRAGSFSAAAEQLLLTQPAVSQHIRDLEAGLGASLFVRSRRGVTLTPAGERLAEYTRAIFRLVAEAENAVADVEHLAGGHIRIGATPGISVYLLPEPIQEFQSRYPRLHVAVQTAITSQITDDLRQGKLELGLIEGELEEPLHPALGVQLLKEVEQWVAVGPRHPWWGRDAVALADLHGQTLILRQRSSQTRIWLDGVLQQHGIRPYIGAEFDNVESIKRAVVNGTGVTILPAYVAEEDVESGRLRLLRVADVTLQRTIKLLWNRETYASPVVTAFLHCLRRCLPDLDVQQITA